jgi:Response regulator containing a CheY-like receiver domain and an HTH DNA-binding domain
MIKRPKIKVFVVDDDNLTIDLLVTPFYKSGFIEFSGRANSGEQCLERLNRKDVDLVLMDINMPGIDGIETAKRLIEIKDNPPKIIFLTVYGDYNFSQKAFDLKASLLGKNIGIEQLLSSIDRIYQGELIINPNPVGVIKEDCNAKLQVVIKNLLNEDQIAIACLIRNGNTAEQIAEALKLDVHHVNNQKREIKNKLSPLNENINAAYLGALMERSGLCKPLNFNDLDNLLPSFK